MYPWAEIGTVLFLDTLIAIKMDGIFILNEGRTIKSVMYGIEIDKLRVKLLIIIIIYVQ